MCNYSSPFYTFRFLTKSSSAVSPIAVDMTQLTATFLLRPGWFLDRSGHSGTCIPFQDLLLGSRPIIPPLLQFDGSTYAFTERGFRNLMGLDNITVPGTHLRSEFLYFLGI